VKKFNEEQFADRKGNIGKVRHSNMALPKHQRQSTQSAVSGAAVNVTSSVQLPHQAK